ncbi:MBL fold metallo-hydrolase [Dyadobacter sp. MSC1_007]|jgi:glyoxylase-like metal-dependent hydrolase (beta-lactamase superfamily II)|uniref:MBL fold metallo-hydrolase n=1 Tax=Dyadobacter sp. MSC1_007 TaxID=2909264 RepID=UPI0038D3F8B7
MDSSRRTFIRKSALLTGAVITKPLTVKISSQVLEQNEDRLVLLSTQGGPFIRSYKQTPSANLIVYKGIPIVIDTGFGGTFKLLDSGIRLAALRYIFITHHHSDHNLELGPLLYNAWLSGLAEPIHVHAPIGLKEMLTAYWESNRYDIETRIRDEGRVDPRPLVISHEFRKEQS